ncbi:MAG: hypothetical protein AAGA30_10775 [Planctomycetota bacterium]
MKSKKTYYYANSQQVELEKNDDFVAFDLDDIKSHKRLVQEFAQEHAEQLRKSVYLVPKKLVTEEVNSVIDKFQAWRPVFQSEDSIIVVLPEIRIADDEHKDIQAKIEDWIKGNADVKKISVGPDRRGRMVVAPDGNDAMGTLEIANSLIEDLKITSAQPRMIQKIKSPRPTGR